MNDLKYHQSWKIQNPKGNIIVLHGLGEHIGRYDEWARNFNEAGYSVYGFDQAGHGRTEGKRGYMMSYDDTYDTIDDLLTEIGSSIPRYIYGHSFGGNMALNYALDRLPKITGLIASAPFITPGKPIPKPLVLIGKLMSSLYPSLALDNGLDLNNLSTDRTVIEEYKADPLVHGKISARLASLMFKHADRLTQFKGDFPLPLLIMHGEYDVLTGPDGSALFAQQVTSPVELKIWPDEFHEIHNGRSKKSVWSMTSKWMDALL